LLAGHRHGGIKTAIIRECKGGRRLIHDAFTDRALLLWRMVDTLIRILGIDPGLRTTGWGVIACHGSRLSFVASGCVRSSPSASLAERLRQLLEGLGEVIGAHGPHEAAVEETFVNRDPQSALKLGQARGVALAAPALAGLPVAEYAANLIKKTVVGSGHAEKPQVAAMVRILLPASTAATPDAADALAVAICHAQHRGAAARLRALATAGRTRE
jgi:crossover junction endodeoxyribonuclease RuvC